MSLLSSSPPDLMCTVSATNYDEKRRERERERERERDRRPHDTSRRRVAGLPNSRLSACCISPLSPDWHLLRREPVRGRWGRSVRSHLRAEWWREQDGHGRRTIGQLRRCGAAASPSRLPGPVGLGHHTWPRRRTSRLDSPCSQRHAASRRDASRDLEGCIALLWSPQVTAPSNGRFDKAQQLPVRDLPVFLRTKSSIRLPAKGKKRKAPRTWKAQCVVTNRPGRTGLDGQSESGGVCQPITIKMWAPRCTVHRCESREMWVLCTVLDAPRLLSLPEPMDHEVGLHCVKRTAELAKLAERPRTWDPSA